MPKPSYTGKSVKQAHRWIAKAFDALAEAHALIPSGRTRLGAYNRLYYSAHHTAVALLRLIGNNSKKHVGIISTFGKEWVVRRGFPARYGKVLRTLYGDREKADYGEYVPTTLKDLDKYDATVKAFILRAQKEIPPISIDNILSVLVRRTLKALRVPEANERSTGDMATGGSQRCCGVRAGKWARTGCSGFGGGKG